MVKKSRMQKRMETEVENKPVTELETETVETENGERFTIWANWARHLACAIPV